MEKITFLIDGFNLYHSVLAIQRDSGVCTKWLDIEALCKSYLHLFGKNNTLESVHYFSALPNYLSSTAPDKITRHKTYISCLRSSNIKIELGRFKEKDTYCTKCKNYFIKHEEKETDVAIGVTLLEIFIKGVCDVAVLVTGDTDLAPAIKKCQSLFPQKKIVFAFPYARKNKELLKLAPGSFSINRKQYIRHQFPNPLVLKNNSKIYKPSSW